MAVHIDGDATKLVSELKKVEQRVKVLEVVNSKLTKTLSELEKASVKAGSSFSKLAQSQGKSLTSTKNSTAALAKHEQQVIKLATSADIWSKAALKQYQLQQQSLSVINSVTAAVQKEATAMAQLALLENKSYVSRLKNTQALEAEISARKRYLGLIEGGNLATKKSMSARAKANKLLNETKVKFDKLTASQDKNTASAKGNAASQRTLTSAIRGTAGAMGKLWFAYGELLPMMAGFIAVTVIKDVEQLGAAFQYTTAFVSELDDAAADAKISVEEIRETLLGFEGLRKGPNELALGMKEFAKAGVSATESLGEMEEMARFATLAEIDLGRATELVVGQTNAFGGSFSATANKIAAGALSSATTIEKFGSALSYTTELGTVMGFSLDDVNTSLALLANKSIVGSKAGTALRTSFMKLLDPSEKAMKMMHKLGVEFSAMNRDGSIKGLEQQLKEFAAQTKDLAEGDLAKLERELVGLRALKGFGNLVADVDEFDAMRSKITGAADDVSFLTDKVEALDDTTVAKWEKLTVSWEKLLVSFSNSALADTGIWMMQAVVDGFKNIASLPGVILAPLLQAQAAWNEFIYKTTETAETKKSLEEFANKFDVLGAKTEKSVEDVEKWGEGVRGILTSLGGEIVVPLDLRVVINSNVDKALESFFGEMDSMTEVEALTAATKLMVKELDAAEKAAIDSTKAIAKAKEKAAKEQEAVDKKVLKGALAAVKERVASAEKEAKALLKQQAALDTYNTTLKKMSDELEPLTEFERLYREEATKTEEALNKLAKQHGVNSDVYEKAKERAEDYLKTWTKESPEALAASNNFLDGLEAGFKDSQKSLMTWGKAGKEVYDAFESGLADSLGDSMRAMLEFDDGLEGIWDSLKDVWDDVTSSMTDAFIDALAQMAAQAAASEVWGWITGKSTAGNSGSGGFISDAIDWVVDLLPFAEGGQISTYASGGLLQGGSGTRDDLYLGTVNGTAHVAMGGEYIVNQKATAKNLPLLETINADTYAFGGSIGSSSGGGFTSTMETNNVLLGELAEVILNEAHETEKNTTATQQATATTQQATAVTQQATEISSGNKEATEDSTEKTFSLTETLSEGWEAMKQFGSDVAESVKDITAKEAAISLGLSLASPALGLAYAGGKTRENYKELTEETKSAEEAAKDLSDTMPALDKAFEDVQISVQGFVDDMENASKDFGNMSADAGAGGHSVGGERGSTTGTGGGYNDGQGGVSGLAAGGRLAKYAGGGVLQGGSHTRDDLYLGTIGGVRQIAMGGEYIVNQKSTDKHLALLEAINADRFAKGGIVGEAYLPSDVFNSLANPEYDSDELKSNYEKDFEAAYEYIQEAAELLQFEGIADYVQALHEVNKAYDEQIDILTTAEATVEDLAVVEKAREIELRKIWEDRQDDIDSLVGADKYQLVTSEMTEYEKAIYDLHEAYKEATIEAHNLGASRQELSIIEQAAGERLADLTKEAYEVIEETLASSEYDLYTQGMTSYEQSVYDLNAEFVDLIDTLNDLGVSEEHLEIATKATGVQLAELTNNMYAAIESAMASTEDILYSNAMSEADKALFDLDNKYENLTETLISLGASVENLDAVEKARGIELATLEAEIAKALAEEELRTSIEKISEEMSDLITEFGDLTGAMETITPTIKTLVEEWAEKSDELAELTAGLNDLVGTVDVTNLDKLTETLSALSSAVSGIEAIDAQIFSLQTSATSQASIDLLKKKEEELFKQLATSIDPEAVSAEWASVVTARIQMQANLESELNQIKIDSLNEQIDSANALIDIIKSMDLYLADLKSGSLSALNYADQLAVSQASYQSILDKAMTGDLEAAGQLQGVGTSYLQEAQAYYGGATSQYANIFAQVTSDLEAFSQQAVTDTDLLQTQIDILEAAEEARADTSGQEIAALTDIREALVEREAVLASQAEKDKKAVEDQINELKNIVSGQEAQIKQQAAIYEGLKENSDKMVAALESLDETSTLEAAAP